MTLYRSLQSVGFLSLAALLLYACQPQSPTLERRTGAAGASRADTDAGVEDEVEEDNEEEEDSGAAFAMSWDDSGNAAITSYKVFIVPPDSNPRFPNASGVPIEVKSYLLGDLTLENGKYSVAVSQADVKAALGALTVEEDKYCFSLVAVNGVGNSVHSAKVCP